MQKKLTVLFAFAIFVLVLGWAITPVQAHCKKNHQGEHIHCTQVDPDFGLRKKPVPLTATFDVVAEDNLQSDVANEPYVHKEDGMKVTAGGALPFRIQVGFLGTGKDPRELDIDVSCNVVPVGNDGDGDPIIIDKCDLLPGEEIIVQSANLFLAAIAYEVCPVDLDGGNGCPDVFTMTPGISELMSFKVMFDGGPLIEIASAIGGANSEDAGRCLSLLTADQRDAFLTNNCTDPADCNVSITASDNDSSSDGNVKWEIDAVGVTALICQTGPGNNVVIGQTTLTFGFDAEKKP